MRKPIIAALIAATAISGIAVPASAQSRGELRRDREQIREEQRELNRAYRRGDRSDIREERRDVREARQEYRQDLRDRQWGRNDWNDYRRTNRNVYARGNWHAPFRYTSFRAGVRIQPAYFGQRYWISDPWRYRLPAPRYGTRWVRHYDDVLLVDFRRGIVLDVIRNFYW